MKDGARTVVRLTICLALTVYFRCWCPASRARGRGESPYAVVGSLKEPRLFTPGVVSTRDYERGGTFTPDGRDYYFVKRAAETYFAAICVSHYSHGRWSAPEVAPFSGQHSDLDPFITPDGSRLFFASSRPVDGKPRADFDIWFMEKTPEDWGEPQHLPEPINTTANENYATVTRDGALYFGSSRAGGKGSYDIYRARFVNGSYGEPENLGDAVNTEFSEIHPFVAPDESYLVFVSIGRADEIVGDGNRYPRGDLYASFRRGGAWRAAKHLGRGVNTAASEFCPNVSPDGRYLFFTSERGFLTTLPRRHLTHREMERGLGTTLNGLGNIYQVDISVLDAVR